MSLRDMSLRDMSPRAMSPRAMSPRATAARRERFARPLLIAFLAVAAADLIGLLAGSGLVHLVAKPLLMPLLAGYAVARRAPAALVAALLFGWGGDVWLLAGSDTAFLIGMGSFAVGHLCYLRLFGRARASLLTGIAYAAVLVTFLMLIRPALPAELRAPLIGYGLLLTVMAWRAGTLGRYAALGGAFFLLSDALIATGIADRPQPPAPDFWIMLTYLAAQSLLTAGALGHRTDSVGGPAGAYREPRISI